MIVTADVDGDVCKDAADEDVVAGAAAAVEPTREEEAIKDVNEAGRVKRSNGLGKSFPKSDRGTRRATDARVEIERFADAVLDEASILGLDG